MSLNLVKSYTPSLGQVASSSGYNTDISALFNAFIGLEAQTASLDGLTITPSANGTTTVNITDASGNALFIFDTLNKTSSVTPTGVILPYGGTTAPSGFLLCDGTSYLQSAYSNLYAIIGTAYGTADGTHFNVPDLRGRFLRGTDSGAGNDPDAATRTAIKTGGNTADNVGSLQTDAFKLHTHTLARGTSGGGFASNVGNFALSDYYGGMTDTGGNETRPVNVNVNYIIKY